MVDICINEGGRDYMEDEFSVLENEQFKLLAVYGKIVSEYIYNASTKKRILHKML